MHPILRLAHLAVLLVALAALGCASSSTPAQPEPAEKAGEASSPTPEPVEVASALAPSLPPVYFDTDSAVLRRDARGVLESHARSIVAHPEWGVLTIDGHCDERGSREYNTRLGKERARAVESFLLSRGVPASRLATRSFGEDRPAARGHDEAAWSRNRRSELQFDTLTSENR